ncbi:MAG: ABC-F family ATP-binding cassette domain-containing protein [Candidatus Sericytochromatia bacterium]|nr:ABC-F family ATP-binding cassette domain-containing protein [Candidatus Tanganyikabacteria bacterium]
MAIKPALLSCRDLGHRMGARVLFDGLAFGVHEDDRIGIVGPNGSGKSTLLRLLAGVDAPDEGERALQRDTVLGYVPQEAVFLQETPEAVLRAALESLPLEEHEKDGRIAETLGRAGFTDPDQPTAKLSGGWRKRLDIARQWVLEPNILLLDEPTNHLDLEGVLWLEGLLRSTSKAFVVVSHDRAFLEAVCNRIVEIDRRHPGGILSIPGNYSRFLEEREAALDSQDAARAALANRVRQEIAWLRKMPQGRQAKQQARVNQAEGLIDDLADARSRAVQRTADVQFAATERKTRKLLEAKGLGKAYGNRSLFGGVDLLLSPGTRVGLLGPNGSGKSTLLGILEGRLQHDTGSLMRADGLVTVHFTQDRSSLDPGQTLRRALCPEGDFVQHQGRPVHVMSWAQRFLFHKDQLELAVGRLSGGEQARLLVARLMLQPADVLILDEPTNDLDIPTLEVLEDSLLDFPGGLVLVTHDRAMLGRLATRLLALDGEGGATWHEDLDQWQDARRQRERARSKPVDKTPAAAPKAKDRGAKLTWREQQEWQGMEAAIEKGEAEVTHLEAAVADPKVASDGWELQQRCTALEQAQAEVARLYERWAELEAKQAGG